jgi:Tol biopolymer transport system component
MVYVSNVSGFYELWASDVDGKNRKQLTHLNTTVRYPRWSHRGDKIAFLAPTEDNRRDQIHIFDLKKNRIQILETGFSQHNRPTWSADDSHIVSGASRTGTTELYLFDILSGEHQQLTDNNARYGTLLASGELIYSTAGRVIFKKSLSSDKQQQTLLRDTMMSSSYSWLVKDEQLYYLRKRGKYIQLVEQDLTTPSNHANHVLIQVPNKSISSSANLSVGPDGSSLLFPQSDLPQSDIMQLFHPKLN